MLRFNLFIVEILGFGSIIQNQPKGPLHHLLASAVGDRGLPVYAVHCTLVHVGVPTKDTASEHCGVNCLLLDTHLFGANSLSVLKRRKANIQTNKPTKRDLC